MVKRIAVAAVAALAVYKTFWWITSPDHALDGRPFRKQAWERAQAEREWPVDSANWN